MQLTPFKALENHLNDFVEQFRDLLKRGKKKVCGRYRR